MDDDTLKRMVERMVRDALMANEATPPNSSDGEVSGNSNVPLHNYRMKAGKGTMVAANWKMNMTTADAKNFAADIRDLTKGERDVLICPPIYLAPLLARALVGTGIGIGGQNMHHEARGAFTSEISPVMLKDAGCEYVILGHSERRHIFGEKDGPINLKVIAALEHGIIPILCVGETLAEHERNATFRIIGNQLKLGLGRTTPNRSRGLVVAYEPVWAIGTGRTATPPAAQNVHSFIRETLTGIYDFATAKEIRILYGGSVTPENAASLIKEKDINGFLVGGASLSAGRFKKIIEAC